MISAGYACFKCRLNILKEFHCECNHDVGIEILQWLEKSKLSIIRKENLYEIQ